MANKGTYTVSVKLVDEATGALKKINQNIAAAQAPMNRFNAQWAKFGKLTGISDVTAKIGNMAKGAANAAVAIAGIGSVTSVAGIYELAKSFGLAGIQLTNMSNSLGIIPGKLIDMQNAARLTGVSADAFNGSMISLSDTLQDAFAGRNVGASNMFKALGIDIRKSAFEAKNASDVLPQIADKIAALNNSPAIQRNLARQLGVESLLPFLRLGAKGIADYQAQVEKFNQMNGAGVAAANRLGVEFTKTSEAAEGFGYTIAETLEPVLTPMLGTVNETIASMAQWVKANQALIQTKVKEWITWIVEEAKKFGKWMGVQNFNDLAKAASDFGSKLKLIGEIGLGLWAGRQIAGLIPLLRILSLIPGSGITAAALAAAGIEIGLVKAADAVTGSVGTQDPVRGGHSGFGQWIYDSSSSLRYADNWLHGDRPARMGTARVGTPDGGNRIDINDQTKHAMDVLQNRYGQSKEAAAAIVASLIPESGLNPDAVGDSGKAHGLAQWHDDRINKYREYSGHPFGDPRTNLDEQLGFVLWETKQKGSMEERAYQDMMNAKTSYAKGSIWRQEYERPRDKEGQGHISGNIAEQLANDPVLQYSNKGSANNVDVTVTHVNPPAGTKISSTSSGPLVSNPKHIVAGVPAYFTDY